MSVSDGARSKVRTCDPYDVNDAAPATLPDGSTVVPHALPVDDTQNEPATADCRGHVGGHLSDTALYHLRWLAGPNRYAWLWPKRPALTPRNLGQPITIPEVPPAIEKREHELHPSVFRICGRYEGAALDPWRALLKAGLATLKGNEITITEAGRRVAGIDLTEAVDD